MPNVSLKTVYQTLNDLAELGEITALDLGTGAARFDPNVESTHHHLVCRSCGKVRDVEADFSGLQVPRVRPRASTCRAPRSSSGDCATSVEESQLQTVNQPSSNTPDQERYNTPCQH